MRDRILDILKNSNKALTVEDIDDRLALKDIHETKEFLSVLSELEEDGEVYHTNKNKYMIFNNGPLKKGIIRMNKKGFGFVESDKEDERDLYIQAKDVNGAMHGDRVIAEITREASGDKRAEGKVVRVVKREVTKIVGIFKPNNSFGFVTPKEKVIKGEY